MPNKAINFMKQLFGKKPEKKRKKSKKQAKKQPEKENRQYFIDLHRYRKRSIQTLPSDTIVCDVGSTLTRIGFAKNDSPQVEIPSYIGHLIGDKQPFREGVMGIKNFFVGEQNIRPKKHLLSINHPIKRGEIEDVNSTSLIMEYGFHRINALSKNVEDLSGRNLLVALRPSATKRKKEALFQTLMETYGMDGCYFALQQPLILYNTGHLTGLVVDSGEEITHVVPVYEGEPLLDAIETVNMGGRTVTDRLAYYLTPHGFRINSPGDRELVNDMKIKMAFVSRGRDGGMASSKPYTLPDGNKIFLDNERYWCTEPLFNPAVIHRQDEQGMATAVTNALMSCNFYIQKQIANNIVPCGGNSLFKGFDERLQLEVNGIAPGCRPQVRRLTAATKPNACWIGGAMLANIPNFGEKLVTQAEFAEEGIRVFRRKCF